MAAGATEAADAKPKRARKAKADAVSVVGRPALIAKLVEAGKTDEQIREEVKTAYPASSKGTVSKIIESKRAKAAKATQ